MSKKNNKLSLKQTKKSKIKLSETPNDQELCDLIENLEDNTYERQKTKTIIDNNVDISKDNKSKKKIKQVSLDCESLYNQMKFLSCCPICKIPFNIYSDKIIDHFRSCKQRNNVSLEIFNELAKAQDNLDILRLKHGLENVNNTKKIKSTNIIKSLEEKLHSIPKSTFTSKKGSSNISKNYTLIKRTSKERENIILDKVALILMETDQVYQDEHYPKLKIKSAFLTLCLKKTKESNRLWILSENNDVPLENYYISSLNLINEKFIIDNVCKNKTKQELKFQMSKDINKLYPQHQNKLCQDWKKLLLSHTYSDLSIIVENNKIVPAHQCVLQVRCPEMLKSKINGNKLILINCTLTSIEFVLHFLYCAFIDTNTTLLEKDIKAINFLITKFSIPELIIYLENMIFIEVFPENKECIETEIYDLKENITKDDCNENKETEINFANCLQSTPKINEIKKTSTSSVYKNSILINLVKSHEHCPETLYESSIQTSKRKSSDNLKSSFKKYKTDIDIIENSLELVDKNLENRNEFKNANNNEFSINNISSDFQNETKKKNNSKNYLSNEEHSSFENYSSLNNISNNLINNSLNNEEIENNGDQNLLNEHTQHSSFESESCLNNISNNLINNSLNNEEKEIKEDKDSFNSSLHNERNNSNIDNDKHSSFGENNHSRNSPLFSKEEYINYKEKINVNTLDTPKLKKSLDKFGIKFLKKRQAISILSHIYEMINLQIGLVSGNNYNQESNNRSNSEESQEKIQTSENIHELIYKKNIIDNTYTNKVLDVTAIPNYCSLNTPLLKKEMNKYGLKNLKRKDAKKILEHIYEMLHPITKENEINEEENSSFCSTDDNETPQFEYESPQHEFNYNSEQIADKLDFVLETEQIKDSGDIYSNFLDLLTRDKTLHNEILLYSPILLKRFNKELKNCNNKKLMDFLDEKAITFRMNPQVNRRKRK